MRPLRRAARSMLGATFVSGGITAVMNPEKLESQAKPITDRLAPLEQKYPNLPTQAPALIRLNGALQLAGGLLLATGRVRRPAALALAASMVPTTLAAHRFWTFDDPDRRRSHRIHFMKNVSLLGGLLLAAADTEGRPGLSWRAGRLARDTRRSMRRMSRSARRNMPMDGMRGMSMDGMRSMTRSTLRNAMSSRPGGMSGSGSQMRRWLTW